MSAFPIGGERAGRSVRILVASALLWSAALLVAALIAPVYGSRTLVQENGSSILWIVGVPLAVTVIVGCALWRREAGRRSGQVAGVIAWTFTGLLVAFNILAMLTIGIFIVPVTAALGAACGISQAANRRERSWSVERGQMHPVGGEKLIQ